MPRPLTDHLMKDTLGALEIKVGQVLITELRSSTYYAELHLRRGKVRTIVSSRPSDAVAVAVRTETPIFVADELMESEGIILALESEEESEEEIPEELVGEFRHFLESVRPEDFDGLRRALRVAAASYAPAWSPRRAHQNPDRPRAPAPPGVPTGRPPPHRPPARRRRRRRPDHHHRHRRLLRGDRHTGAVAGSRRHHRRDHHVGRRSGAPPAP